MPGDELVRFRLECSTSLYEQSTDILDQARYVTVWTGFAKRFSYDCCTVQSTVCYGLVRLNTTFTWLTGYLQGLHTVPPTYMYVRVRFYTNYIRYWHGRAHTWSELIVRLYIRTRTVSHSLSRSCTVSQGLVRSLIRLNTAHGTRVSFLSLKNHTRLSRIHSNGPRVTRKRPRLVRLYVRFTRMANRISHVFCVRQALNRFQGAPTSPLIQMLIKTSRYLVCMKDT